MQKIKDYSISIGIFAFLAILAWALATGRTGGQYESKINANAKWIEQNDPLIKKIPVLESEIKNIIDNGNKTLESVKRIEDILIKK